ncbi:GATA-binding transcription factor [Pseudohyphozyma bogoriensis]|nr:GATA-binding transcription factor [Pseudohyphozyma bogoriensis]
MPALGRTRCYWCIMSPSLDFLYLDPVLYTHLNDEATLLLGTNLLDYVHPDEAENLGKDLVGDNGIQEGGVFGSVTTCRYSRISRIRKLMGAQNPYVPPEASQYSIDDEYIALKITTSWIGPPAAPGTKGKGAVLAFFHAVEDIPATNSDEQLRKQWSNLCGPLVKDGVYLPQWRAEQLLLALSRSPAVFLGETPNGGAPAAVFQILDHEGKIIVSFPDRSESYKREEYADLAREVLARPRSIVDANTSCTRRFRSKHPLMSGGTFTTVESVVILYGAISFACFQTEAQYLPSTATPAFTSVSSTNQHGAFDLSTGVVNGGGGASEYYDDLSASTSSRKRLSSSTSIYSNGTDEHDYDQAKRSRLSGPLPPFSVDSHLTTHQPSPAQAQGPPTLSIATAPRHLSLRTEGVVNAQNGAGELSPTVATASAILGSFSNFGATNGHAHRGLGLGDSWGAGGANGGTHHPLAPAHGHPPLVSSPYDSPVLTSSSVASSEQQNASTSASTSAADGTPQPNPNPPFPIPNLKAGSKNQPGGAGGGTGMGVGGEKKEPVNKPSAKACESCGTINSPEWRKGPSGTKSLCNACGLRYARSIARQQKLLDPEGEERRKKERADKKKEKKEKVLEDARRKMGIGEDGRPLPLIRTNANSQTPDAPSSASSSSTPNPDGSHYPRLMDEHGNVDVVGVGGIGATGGGAPGFSGMVASRDLVMQMGDRAKEQGSHGWFGPTSDEPNRGLMAGVHGGPDEARGWHAGANGWDFDARRSGAGYE